MAEISAVDIVDPILEATIQEWSDRLDEEAREQVQLAFSGSRQLSLRSFRDQTSHELRTSPIFSTLEAHSTALIPFDFARSSRRTSSHQGDLDFAVPTRLSPLSQISQ